MVYWHHMMTQRLVNIGSADDSLPDSAMPLPHPLVTRQQLVPSEQTSAKFDKNTVGLFINNISMVFPIPWKFSFAVIPVPTK